MKEIRWSHFGSLNLMQKAAKNKTSFAGASTSARSCQNQEVLFLETTNEAAAAASNLCLLLIHRTLQVCRQETIFHCRLNKSPSLPPTATQRQTPGRIVTRMLLPSLHFLLGTAAPQEALGGCEGPAVNKPPGPRPLV